MKLLVSTHSFLLEVVFGTDFNLKSINRIAGHHYGICLLPEGFVATMTRAENAITVYSCSEADPILQKKEEYIPTGEYEDIHQIAQQDGFMLVANTGFNELSLIQDGKLFSRYRFGGFSNDVNHVNSVFPVGERKMLVMLRNRGRVNSEICVLERSNDGVESIARFPMWDAGCHNVYTDGKTMVYNASGIGDFVAVDMATQSVIKRRRFPGHTKGLAVTNDHYIVGYSDHVPRKSRYISNGHMAFVNRENFNIDATIDLNRINGPIGNINEIRCLTGEDFSNGLRLDLDVKWENLRMADQDWVYKYFSRHAKYLARKILKLCRM